MHLNKGKSIFYETFCLSKLYANHMMVFIFSKSLIFEFTCWHSVSYVLIIYFPFIFSFTRYLSFWRRWSIDLTGSSNLILQICNKWWAMSKCISFEDFSTYFFKTVFIAPTGVSDFKLELQTSRVERIKVSYGSTI